MAQVKEQWFGANPPCPRYVQLAAVGGGILEITLTCSAQSGCSATASASLAGSCSSRGDANATLEDKTVNGTVFYKSASHTVKAEGRLGATVDDDSVGIELEGLEGDQFEDNQYETLAGLCAALAQRYPVTHVAGHEHVAPDRKQDPGPGFAWRRLHDALAWPARYFPDGVLTQHPV